MPEIKAVTYAARASDDFEEGWTIHTHAGKNVSLATNSLGFPLITNESVELIKNFGEKKKENVNALVSEAGSFRPWKEMPDRTASTILKSLLKSTIAPGGTPSHFWCSSSGYDPPTGLNDVTYDVETDLNRNVILITRVTDLGVGPANAQKSRVYRVIYDWGGDEPVVKAEVNTAPRRGVAFVAFLAVASVASLFMAGCDLVTQEVHLVDSEFVNVVGDVSDTHNLTVSDQEFLASLDDGNNVNVGAFDDLFDEPLFDEPISDPPDDRSARDKRNRDSVLRSKAAIEEYYRKMFPTVNETDMKYLVHDCMNHFPELAGCIVCAEANQKKKSKTHKRLNKQLRNRFHFDTIGPI